ncbi:MAG: methionyl-tRNA formyltransferase [Clostridiales bacterium]|nr:methionyl-tRNA formyltransferase [Clostridiales bacterium]
MRIVFMGTPELAATALKALYDAGHELPLVITQPDRPKGRGGKPAFSPVKAYAGDKGIPIFQPDGLKDPLTLKMVAEASPEVIVVAAYGRLLPAAMLEAAPLGCLNVHASLLPAYRGAAPIQQVLLDGGAETGVTIMKMDEGLDTGPILLSEKLPIPADMDFGGLYQALSDLGARLLLEALPLWAGGGLKPQAQPAEGASYVERLGRRHEIIDWTKPAEAIRNQIRAFSPSPGAAAVYDGKELKILAARFPTAEETAALESGTGQAGEIVGLIRRAGPAVAAGEGYIVLTKVQPAGKKPMDGWSWLNGSRAEAGGRFQPQSSEDGES